MEWFSQYLRACANCGFSFARADTLLCRNCEELCSEDLSYKAFRRETQGGRIEGVALWAWVPGKNEALSSLLLTLKGGLQTKAYNYYAKKLIQQRQACLKETVCGDLIIIPAPSSNNGEKDHARSLSKALSEAMGSQVVELLAKRDSVHQRDLNLEERGRISLKTNEKFSKEQVEKMIEEKTVIFVDDVVTTGSTAIAAKAILHNCKRFEVLCLAQRETCPNNHFLV